MTNPTILCVDDERNVLLTLRTQLARQFPKYAIETAESAAEALALIEELTAEGVEVPLVIADQIMPGMRGDEFLIQLHQRHPDTLKVMLTGYARMEEVVNVVNRGNLYRFLTKPWHESDLLLTVTEALRRYEQERQLTQQQAELAAANRELARLNAALEQQVQERTQQLQSVVDLNQQVVATAQEGIIVWDQDLRYQVWNRYMENLSGFSAATVIGQYCLDVFPNLQESGVFDLLQRALAGETVYTPDAYFHIPETGRSGWSFECFTPLRDAKGDVIGVLGTVHDVTDRKQAELEQQQLLKLLSDMKFALDQAAIVVTTDAQGRIIDVNDRFCEISQYTREELMGSTHQLINSAYHSTEFFQDLWQTVASGQVWKGEIKNRAKNGTEYWVDTVIVPFLDHTGVPFQYMAVRFDITAQKRVEVALRESEEQNRAILSALPDILTVINAEGVYLSCSYNRFSGQLIDVENIDLVGLHVSQVLPAESVPICLAAVQQALATGEMQVYEQHVQFGDRIQYEEARIVPYHADRVLCMVRNITDRKHIENSLRQSEAKQNALIHALPDLIMRISRDGIYQDFFTTSVFKVIGDRESLVGTRVDESLPPELAQRRMTAIAAALETGDLQVYEQNLSVEGVVRTEECRVVPCGIDEVLVIGRDITDRKQAELALSDSERRYAALANNSPVGIFQTDPLGECIYVNPKWCQLSGLTPEAVVGANWAQALYPDDREWVVLIWAEAVRQQANFTLECRFQLPTGQINWIYVQAAPLFDRAGDYTGYLGTVTDISDRKQVEVALRQSEAKNRAMLAAIPDLLLRVKQDGTCLDFIPPSSTVEPGFIPIRATLAEVLPTDILEYQKERMQQALATGELQVWEQQLTRFGTICEEEVRLVHCEDDEFVIIVRDITERKRAEAALRQSEAKNRAIIEAIPDCLLRIGRDGSCYDFIPPVGDRAGSFVPVFQHIAEILPPDVLQHQLQRMEQAFDTGELQVWEHQISKYGSLCDEEVRLVPCGPAECLVIVRDISDRKQAEAALKDSEERYRLIVETQTDLVMRSAPDTTITFANATLCRVLGQSLDQIKGTQWNQFVPPEDINHIQQKIAHLSPATPTFENLNPDYRPNGDIGWTQWVNLGIFNEQGELIEIQSVGRDITDLKRAEAALQDSEAKYRRIVETANEGIWIIDTEDKTSFVNPKMAAMLGYHVDEMLGKTLFGFMDEADIEIAKQHTEWGRQGLAEQFDFKFQHKNGHDVWTLISTSPILDDAGQYIGALAMITDISDRKQTEVSLQHTNQLLSAISEAQTRFITDSNPATLFDHLLETLLQLTNSEYGFIGEILYNAEGNAYVDESYMKMRGQPYLKAKAITDIAWNEETRQLYDDRGSQGMEFHNLKTLFGQVIVTGQPVIANSPSTDLRRGGLPDGHPALNAFLGIPFYRGEQLVGMVGIANRPEGYSEADILELEPFLTTCASTIEAYRNDTRRQQAEQALRQSEALQNAIIQAIPDLLIRMTQDGGYQQPISNNYTRSLLPNSLMEEVALNDILPVHLAQQRLHFAELALQTNDLQMYEQTLEIDGQIYNEEVRIVPLLEQDVLVIIRDITDRKQVEAAFQEKQQQLHSLLNNIPHIAWLKDRESRYLAVNEPFAQACGYTAAELVGLTDQDVWSPRFAAAYVQDDRDLMVSRCQKRFEEPLLTSAGEERWIETIKTPILDDQGDPIGTAGIAMDITERKRTELALQQLNAELEQRVQERTQELARSEQDLRTIFNNVYDAILIHDLDGTILDMNDRALELRGATREQLLAASIADLSAPDAPLERLPEILQQVQAGETLRFEWREQRFDNQLTFDVEVSLRKVTLGDRPVMIAGVRDISDRKQAEIALRNSEARFQAFMNNSPAISWITDGNGVNLYMSQTYFQTFQLATTDAVGKSVFELFPPDIAQQFLENTQRVILTNQVVETVEVGPRIDGTLGDFLVYKFPIPEASGQCLVGGVAIDITDRKKAEAALRESEQRYATLADAAPVGIYRTDATGECLYVNERWCNIAGLTATEARGYGWTQALHPDDRDLIARTWEHFVQTGETFRLEYRFQRPDGRTTWVFGQAVRELDEHGSLVGYVGTITDISDRKRAEEALQAERLRLQLALDAAQMGTWSCNLATGKLIWSEQAQELFGYLPGTFPGDRETFLSHVYPDDLDYVIQAINHTFQTGDPYHIEYRICRLDGEVRWLTVWGIIPQNAPEPERQIIGVVCDSTHRKQAEEALQQAMTTNQALLNAIPDLILLISRDGIYREAIANREMTSLLPRTEQIGKSVWEVLPAELAQQRLDVIAQAFATGVPQIHEYQIVIHGELRYEEARCVVCREDEAMVLVRDISDRKQAEADLQESRNMLKLVLDTIPQRVFWKNRESRFLGCNTAFANDYQLTFEDIVGKTDQELPWAEWAHLYQADDDRIINTRESKLNYEEPTNNLHGEQIWIRTSKIPLTNSQGEVIGIMGSYDDITARKRAELAMQESEDRFRTLFEATPNPIQGYDKERRVIFWNQASEILYGYTYAEAIGKRIEELIIPEDLQATFVATMDHWIAEGNVPLANGELQLRNKQGERVEVYSSHIMLTSISGDREMYCIDVDLRERKQAEAQLREQEQFLRSIYEGADQPIFVGDVLPNQSIRVVGWNPTAARLTGRSSDEIAGQTVEQIFPPEEATEMLARYAQCISTRQSATFEECMPLPHEVRWMLSTYNPLINEEGRVYRVVGTVYDITDRKRLEQELRQINAELEQRVKERTLDLQQAMETAEAANRAKSTFLANMSHELRTPLNAILGFAQLMCRDLTLEPEKRNQLSIINRSGKHLLSLINDILEMSKIEAGRVNFVPTCFDLQTQVQALEEMFQLRAREKGLQFIIYFDPSLPRYIETDENKLRQVLINLIGNAIKFTKVGYVHLRIQAVPPFPTVARTSLVLRFEVEDTGVGIDPVELESLFEPFIQSSNRQVSQEGTGLGLPISRQFVRLLGGDLTVTSRLGGGSQFAFAIPVNLADPIALPDLIAHRHILGVAPNQPQYRILVVEDDDSSRQLLVQLLQSVGFEVQAAHNGKEAIELWQRWQPQCVWMDMRMPVMNGYEATRQIRARELDPSTVIIALTASAFEEDRARVLQIGCNDFVRKPFQEHELLEKMADYLGVQYLYADELAPFGAAMAPAPGWDAVSELRSLPIHVLTQMQDATVQLNSEQLYQLIHQLEPNHPQLADFLRDQVDNFDFDQILLILQEILP